MAYDSENTVFKATFRIGHLMTQTLPIIIKVAVVFYFADGNVHRMHLSGVRFPNQHSRGKIKGRDSNPRERDHLLF